jgi:NAD(P)-dependent dehydrogenase (short-subunit alcohol dehydrogenase family)
MPDATAYPSCEELVEMIDDNWQEKAVLITGGSSGVGLATAREFLGRGARVMITGRSADRLAEAARRLAPPANRLVTFSADVRQVDNCQAAVARALDMFGRLDVLVNSAGVWVEGDSEATTEQEWDRVIDTNLKGTFFMCARAIPALKATRGCIINVSSDAGIMGIKGAAIYCASKGGVNLLTRSLALELAEHLVRVVAVCPADINTPMLRDQADTFGDPGPDAYLQHLLAQYPQGPAARFIEPGEVARLIFFLASSAATPITGATISIDFGLTAGY